MPFGQRASLIVRALDSRNYRLFFFGQIVSLLGTWMTTTATNWLVYRLTGSAWLLGVVGFSGQIPSFLLGPLAGIAIDRVNRHRLLMITQSISMLQSLALAVLTLSGRITIEWVIVLCLVQGLTNAFDMPARQSFLISLIDRREDLGNAIALNSSMVNAARLVGPAIAGLVIASVGEGWCFLIDGLSYVAVLIGLSRMRFPAARAAAPRRQGAVADLIEGFRYVAGFAPIRSVMLLLALVSFVGVPYSVLLPVFASGVFHGGPSTLGLLMMASGAGALSGALLLAARKSVVGLGRWIAISSALFGTGLIGFSLAPALWVAVPCLALAGFGFMVQMASSNTIVQTVVDDEKRGRVMSLYMMAFLGTVPFGSLTAGWLTSRIGAAGTLAIGGVCCLAGAAAFARALPSLRAAVRPIYVRLGILPEVAAGLAVEAAVSVPPERQ